MKYSCITAYGLTGMPFRWMNIGLKCVVVTCSIPFSHSPVEKPGPQTLGGVRRMRPAVEPDRAVRVLEEARQRVRDQPAADRIDDLADVRARVRASHRIRRRRAGATDARGSAWIVEFHVSAFCLPAAFSGKPVKLPSSGPGIDANQPLLVVDHRPRADELDLRRLSPAGAWAESGD